MMQKIMYPSTSAQIDKKMMEEKGIPGIILMERAASAIAYEAMKLMSEKGLILVVCGGGNNGGDGYAAARILLSHGYDVKCLSLSEKTMPDDSELNRNIIKKCNDVYIPLNEENIDSVFDEYKNCGLVIDAIFGTGLSREPAGIYKRAIENMNALDKKIVSVDIPSGTFGASGSYSCSVKADVTVTFQYMKPAHVLYPSAENCGSIKVYPIGFDETVEDMFYIDSLSMPKRKRNTHKGTYGSLMIAAGSKGMAGAAVLAASASVSGGTGLTKLVCPELVEKVAQNRVVEATCIACGTDSLSFESFPFDLIKSAIAAGPGLGKGEDIRRILLKLLESDAPKVFDADALNNLAADDFLGSKKLVITPHPKEFSRLFGPSVKEIVEEPVLMAKKFAEEFGITILLKGASTVVSNGKEIYIVNSGSPAMAKGGSGDVLTGLIGSFLAQGMDDIKAAYSAAYFCGKAGEAAAKKYGEYAAKASDTVNELGRVMSGLL